MIKMNNPTYKVRLQIFFITILKINLVNAKVYVAKTFVLLFLNCLRSVIKNFTVDYRMQK